VGVTMRWKTMIDKIRFDQTGATAIEYGLILSLMVIAMMFGLNAFAASADGVWQNVRISVTTAIGA
jgi:pilus assembly protein Flp/PilA